MRRDLLDRSCPPPPPDPVQEALDYELRRSLNHRSRVVMTPAGRFGSIAMAAEAFGIAPETARRRALYRRDGWRFVATPRRPDVPPVPKPKRRPQGAHLKDRRRHPPGPAGADPLGPLRQRGAGRRGARAHPAGGLAPGPARGGRMEVRVSVEDDLP